jgi:hypothetical protein
VLRSSQPTRPVLRYLPEEYQPKPEATWASDTTGVIRVSGGDSNFLNNGLQQDMGTAFAVETSVSPTTRVRISGSLGYAAASGLPSASIRTSYARDRFGRPGPQISLMMRQAYFAAPVNGNQNAPALRTATVSSIDSVDLMDDLRLDYGFAIDSITLYGRMNYFSPFARATYTTDNGGEMKVAYSSGFAPTEMLARSPWRHGTFDADLAALTQAPRISRRNNEAAVERTKNYEVGYEFVDGKRTYSAMAFREEVGNAVFLMSGDIGLASAANLMPDLNSRGTVFNVGNYQRSGMQLAFTQMVNQLLEIVVAAGRAEALTSDGTGDASGTLREHMRQAPRTWATVRVNSSIPRTGTYLMTSYGWTDFRTLTPIHQSLTGPTYQDLGWNVRAQQPLPGMMGVRMELVAELRNALAQGYLTLHHKDGRKAVLTNTPRQARLGASFIF